MVVFCCVRVIIVVMWSVIVVVVWSMIVVVMWSVIVVVVWSMIVVVVAMSIRVNMTVIIRYVHKSRQNCIIYVFSLIENDIAGKRKYKKGNLRILSLNAHMIFFM